MEKFRVNEKSLIALQVPEDILDELRSICFRLPEVVEETAWTGVRWVVSRKNFAHVVAVDKGWPPAYARAAGVRGPAFILTFRTFEIAASVDTFATYPYFVPGWFENIVGLFIDDEIDWDVVQAHIRESYCVLAPRKLSAAISLVNAPQL